MLYVQTTGPEELQELRSLLDESPFIALDDVRQPLVENGHISSLARMYEKKNDQHALIELYVKVADGVWKDDSISDPVGKAKKLLQGSKDRGMVQKYALWLLKRDRLGGLKVSGEIYLFRSFSYIIYSYSSPTNQNARHRQRRTPISSLKSVTSTRELEPNSSNILFYRRRLLILPCTHNS